MGSCNGCSGRKVAGKSPISRAGSVGKVTVKRPGPSVLNVGGGATNRMVARMKAGYGKGFRRTTRP